MAAWANKAVNKKAKSKGVTDKRYTTQLFEGLLSDTHGINKKSRETHISLLARVTISSERMSTWNLLLVVHVDDMYLQMVWNSSS